MPPRGRIPEGLESFLFSQFRYPNLMHTAYPETMTFPKGLATAPDLSGLIDETIKRFTEEWRLLRIPVALEFPKELEALYEAETRQKRVRELRFTVLAAAGFMCATTFTDKVLLPDIGWNGLNLRLVGSAAFILAAYLFGKVSGAIRESALSVVGFFVVNVIIGIPSLSRAPMAPYGMFIAFMAIIYANTTFPMRFQHAWPWNLLCLITIATYMHFDPVVSSGLTAALMFMGVVAASYTLIANYRMEQGARLGYLLASKEALRLFALNRDREELATLSSTDALTGLANRGHFDRRLATLFDGSAGTGTEIYLIMMDVDFFKRYNDVYGHPAGDACLRSIATVLMAAVRGEKDFAFRYGGEEFGALLVETSKLQAEKIAERIRNSVEQAAIKHSNRGDGLDVVTVSIGVAPAMAGDGTTAESLIERADKSLYASKNAGRNRVSFTNTE